MTQLFEITYQDIHQLTDTQLTDLLRRLLHLEAARFNIAASSVDVALNINVPDGGEDGRIQWTGEPTRTAYVPNRLTMFQCKATNMEPAACAKELRRKRSQHLKPRVEEVLDAGGSYVLLTTQALNSHQITQRIKYMREAIKAAGKPYAETANLHIYDANKIRDWINSSISAITAVCLWRGRPLLPGLQTWEHWSGLIEYQRFPFVSSVDTDEHIAQLRCALAEPRQVARIIGLSGLGKTRLALEAFRPASPDDVATERLHHRVVYIDAAHGISHLPATVSDWCVQGLEGILVVDNWEMSHRC